MPTRVSKDTVYTWVSSKRMPGHRFDAFVADLTKGKDATRGRVVLERD